MSEPQFTSDLDVRWMSRRRWRLLAPLTYVTGEKEHLRVPSEFVTDFASIPRAFRWLVVRDAEAARPSTLHDWLIRTQAVKDRKADRLFSEALKADGVPRLRRGVLYLGVRIGSAFRRR